MIFGQTLSGPMPGHEPIMPAALSHYDLHVWLWKDNPRGLFTSTNSAVKCDPAAPYTHRYGEHAHWKSTAGSRGSFPSFDEMTRDGDSRASLVH